MAIGLPYAYGATDSEAGLDPTFSSRIDPLIVQIQVMQNAQSTTKIAAWIQ